MSQTTAIVVAAGSGVRLGGRDKAFLPLGGQPLVSYCLDVLQQCRAIHSILLVVRSSSISDAEALVASHALDKVTRICSGGDTRTESVRQGLAHVSQEADIVLIHDGVRPFLTEALVLRGLTAVQETGAAIAGVPAQDTIKMADREDVIVETPPRDHLWVAQTPQVFYTSILQEAYRAQGGPAPDDAALVEACGYRVKLFAGSLLNFKITTQDDIELAQAVLADRRRHAHRPGS